MIKTWGLEKIINAPDELHFRPNTLEAFLSGHSVEGIENLSGLESVLEVCTEPIGEVIEACKGVDGNGVWELIVPARKGTLLREEVGMDEVTECVRWLSGSYMGREFRDWTGIPLKLYVDSWDVTKDIIDLIAEMLECRARSERYAALLPAVISEWVIGDGLVTALNRLRGIRSLSGDSPWSEEWLSIVSKDPSDLLSLGTMGVNVGRVDGELCCLTNIGIVAEEQVNSSIPCWIPSPEGELKEVFVGVALDSVWLPWSGVTVHCDTTFKLTLERVG